MPHSDKIDKEQERYNFREYRKRQIFKVLEILALLIMIIIVVAVCLGAMWAMGYFSVQNPIDAIPTFVP